MRDIVDDIDHHRLCCFKIIFKGYSRGIGNCSLSVFKTLRFIFYMKLIELRWVLGCDFLKEK